MRLLMCLLNGSGVETNTGDEQSRRSEVRSAKQVGKGGQEALRTVGVVPRVRLLHGLAQFRQLARVP